jgi:hypothetical protein
MMSLSALLLALLLGSSRLFGLFIEPFDVLVVSVRLHVDQAHHFAVEVEEKGNNVSYGSTHEFAAIHEIKSRDRGTRTVILTVVMIRNTEKKFNDSSLFLLRTIEKARSRPLI